MVRSLIGIVVVGIVTLTGCCKTPPSSESDLSASAAASASAAPTVNVPAAASVSPPDAKYTDAKTLKQLQRELDELHEKLMKAKGAGGAAHAGSRCARGFCPRCDSERRETLQRPHAPEPDLGPWRRELRGRGVARRTPRRIQRVTPGPTPYG